MSFDILSVCLFFLQVLREPVELAGPELSIVIDPVGGVAKRLGVEAQAVFAALPAALQQAGLLEYADVFRDGGQRHSKRGGDRRDRHFSVRDPSQDGSPCRVGQGKKHSAQRLG
jgi:hypothetical protein